MATATQVELSTSTSEPHIAISPKSDFPASGEDGNPHSATQWADFIRSGFEAMRNGSKLNIDCLNAPRRRHADSISAALAVETAALLYPAPSDSSVPQIIKYEKDIVSLRKAIKAQQEAEETARIDIRLGKPWRDRVLAQGPWDEENDPLPLTGPPALPMPVKISDEESLAPFFRHLGGGGTRDTFDALDASRGYEAYYGVELAEFGKGLLYEDGRMDLCKKVLGPPNITALMASLEHNTFVRHFLLGNNMVGLAGARAIAEFVYKHPDKIETWYLAGNCIDLFGFECLVLAWTRSTSITNIWLKRNPLGPNSSAALFELITKSPNLRTLDLDLTELGDKGVARLFILLADYQSGSLPLRHIYLNAVGIGESACTAIAHYLSSSHCELDSLYMSCNPIGDAGAIALAQGLPSNSSLSRLSMSSCGLKFTGANHLLRALHHHPRLMTLNLGQNFATEDVGARYNWLDDGVVDGLRSLVRDSQTLKMLDLGSTAMTPPAFAELGLEVGKSQSLVVFEAKSVCGKLNSEVKLLVNNRIKNNVQHFCGRDMTHFEQEEKRWLISPRDVRLIDSMYRNRDTGLARRGLLRLKKTWEDGLEAVENVMRANDVQLVT